VAVSVTKLQWYDEDKCFAAAFSDGVVSLSTKDSFISPIIIDAHKVTVALWRAQFCQFVDKHVQWHQFHQGKGNCCCSDEGGRANDVFWPPKLLD